MVNSHTDCHAAVRNHMPGNLVFSSLGFSPALQSPASAMVSLSPDGHSHHAPHNLVPFPTQSWWGGRAEGGCSCPSVPVPHQPASSEHARVTQWQVSVTAPCPGYLFCLLMAETPWPGDMVWANIKTVTGEGLWPVTRGKLSSCVSLGWKVKGETTGGQPGMWHLL